MKEIVMLKTGLGYVAANGSKIKNYGKKVGHAESGDGMNMKSQQAHVKKLLGSVHKMNTGGNVVVGNTSYTQNKESGLKTRIEHEGGQYVMYSWAPSDRRINDEEENK